MIEPLDQGCVFWYQKFFAEKILSQIANESFGMISSLRPFFRLQNDIKILNNAVEIRKVWFLRFSNIIFFQVEATPQNAICDDLNFQSNARNPQNKNLHFHFFKLLHLASLKRAKHLFACCVLNLFSNAKIAQISFWKEVFHFFKFRKKVVISKYAPLLWTLLESCAGHEDKIFGVCEAHSRISVK